MVLARSMFSCESQKSSNVKAARCKLPCVIGLFIEYVVHKCKLASGLARLSSLESPRSDVVKDCATMHCFTAEQR